MDSHTPKAERMPRITWTLILKLCVAITIAVSIAISVGLAWAMLFVAGDIAYAWWRIKAAGKHGERQKSSWSKTLR